MAGNFFENEIRDSLASLISAGRIKIDKSSDKFFSELSKAFPSKGGKIDWSLVPGSTERFQAEKSLQPSDFFDFFEKVGADFKLAGEVSYAGDSATDFVLSCEFGDVRKVLNVLLEVPQHHYFAGANCSWCLCFTMEGGMGFGYRAIA